MAIAIVGSAAYQHYDSFTENNHTLNVTVPAGAEVLLIGIVINDYDWGKLTGLTVGGSAAGVTQVGTTAPGIANRSCRWYRLLTPTAGAQSIVASYNTSSNNAGAMLALCLTGVDTGALIDSSPASSSSAGASPFTTAVAAAPAGSLVLAACYADTAQPTPGAGQTALGTNEQNHCFSHRTAAAAMEATFTGSPQIGQSVIVVKAGGGGGGSPPTLSGPTGTKTGTTTGTGTVTTTETGGTLYYRATANATETAATVKAGSSKTVAALNESVSLTGLTAAMTYYLHYLHTGANGDSAVASSASFTTDAGGSSGTFTSGTLVRNNDAASGASLSWVTFLNKTTGAHVLTKTGVTLTAGVFTVTDAALAVGTEYHATWREAGGQIGWGLAVAS